MTRLNAKMAVFLSVFLTAAGLVFAQEKINISGSVEWDTMRINSGVTLDLSSSGIRLPSGRTHAESLLKNGYKSRILQFIMQLQFDSSSTIADLVSRGEISIAEIEAAAETSASVPPSFSSDMRKMQASHSISISNLSASFIRHRNPAPIIRTLNPVSTADYTGIIIIAADELPVHGMLKKEKPVPCLFPKIWDSEMNLIYERNMIDPRSITMTRYSTLENIFNKNPSGLSKELLEIAGERPLRIFARGVFGIKPTDLIIDRSDALSIISSEANRSLLSQGKVVIILDESVLRSQFSGE